MTLQVSLTERALTRRARLQGFLFFACTDITQHRRFFRLFYFQLTSLFVVICNLSESCIDLELRLLVECFFTNWAAAVMPVVPASFQADFAEVVSTWSGDWICEHLQTDGTLELLTQRTSWKEEMRYKWDIKSIKYKSIICYFNKRVTDLHRDEFGLVVDSAIAFPLLNI